MKATSKSSHKKVHKSKPNPSFSMGNEAKNSCKDGHMFLGAAKTRFCSISKHRISSTGRLQQALCSGLEPGAGDPWSQQTPSGWDFEDPWNAGEMAASSSKNEAHASRVSQPLPPIPTAKKTGLGIDLKHEPISITTVLGLLSRAMQWRSLFFWWTMWNTQSTVDYFVIWREANM